MNQRVALSQHRLFNQIRYTGYYISHLLSSWGLLCLYDHSFQVIVLLQAIYFGFHYSFSSHIKFLGVFELWIILPSVLNILPIIPNKWSPLWGEMGFYLQVITMGDKWDINKCFRRQLFWIVESDDTNKCNTRIVYWSIERCDVNAYTPNTSRED